MKLSYLITFIGFASAGSMYDNSSGNRQQLVQKLLSIDREIAMLEGTATLDE